VRAVPVVVAVVDVGDASFEVSVTTTVVVDTDAGSVASLPGAGATVLPVEDVHPATTTKATTTAVTPRIPTMHLLTLRMAVCAHPR
jgi:hypothetical protein